MSDYTTVSQVKADIPDSPLFSTTDTSYDSVIAGMITAASRLIDKEVGGWPGYFYPSTADTTRYFDGNGDKELYIDPMVSLTSVSVAESDGRAAADYTAWTLDTDYYVGPYNYSQIGSPITHLIIDNDAGSKGSFHRFRKSVKVTGVFGYSASAPADIEQACKITAVRWFQRAKQGYQDGGANPMTGELIYVQSLDPDVKTLLTPYKIGNMVF
jgi:hypothetical protein